MIRFRTVTAGVLVAALLTGGAAMAQGPRGGPGRGGGIGRGGGLPLAALNLTQAQQDLVRDIRERGRESGRVLEQRLRDAQDAQRQAVNAIPVNEPAIRTATLALAEVQADVAIHQARVQTEVWNALTADQQAEVKRLQAQQQQRRAQRPARQ